MKRLAAALWRDFPLLNYCLYAWSIAHAEIANLEPQRLEYVGTCVFPLLVPLAVYGLRWRGADRFERLVGIGVTAVTVGAIVLSLFAAERVVFSNDELRVIYEWSAIGNTALALLHAWSMDRPRVLWLLGPAALYGLLLENGGILLGFFDELHYTLYLGPLPAPVATMAGWVLVYYLVTWVAWEVRAHLPRVRASVALSALVATAAGLLLDLQIDPMATAVGFWRWHRALPGTVFDVPLVNFVAWGSAIFPFAWALFARQNALGLSPADTARAPHRRWLLARVPVVLAAAALLFLSASAVVELGVSGPTFLVLRGAAVRFGVVRPDAAWVP